MRHGRALDLEWLPLPSPLGTGVVLMLALEEGSVACVDTWMTRLANGEGRHRNMHMRARLGGVWPCMPGRVLLGAGYVEMKDCTGVGERKRDAL